jgi:hypothetical protein
MSAESLLPWFPSSGHEAMGFLDHRDICLVAGKDPYAWKGTADLMHPHVRPEAVAAVPDRRTPNQTSLQRPHCLGAQVPTGCRWASHLAR